MSRDPSCRGCDARLQLAQAVLPVCDGERCHVVGNDGVAILAPFLSFAQQRHLLKVLDVERHPEERVAQLLVKRCKQTQLAEVEVDVPAVSWAAFVFREELAVGGELEEVALVAQICHGLILRAQLELDALELEMIYLLLDCEERLLVVRFGHRRSPVVYLWRQFYQLVRRVVEDPLTSSIDVEADACLAAGAMGAPPTGACIVPIAATVV